MDLSFYLILGFFNIIFIKINNRNIKITFLLKINILLYIYYYIINNTLFLK